MSSEIRIINLLLVLFLFVFVTGCQSSDVEPPPTPEPTSRPALLQTLEVRTPDFEIFFDDENCTVEGPDEIKIGEYFVVLHNDVDLPAQFFIDRYTGEGSFEDHLAWREEKCGGQGSHCEEEDYYPRVALLNAISQANDGHKTYYKVFNFTMPGNYIIGVSKDGWWGWMCKPLTVTN